MASAATPSTEPAGRESSRRLRVVIVGTGMIAHVHRHAVLLAGAVLVGVIGSTPERTRQVAEQWAVPQMQSMTEAADAGADVVHVCTPNGTHSELSRAALAAGMNVVCEKPLGLDAAEAEIMDGAATRAGLVATVPFVYRYHPIVREIRARRLRGELGDLNFIHGSYLQDWMLNPATGNWRVDAKQSGSSRAFADIGSHWCDLVEWVSGERFTSVVAATSVAYPTRPARSTQAFSNADGQGGLAAVNTEDVASALFRTASGILANVAVSQVAAGRKNRLWFELDGSAGSAAFDQETPESAWFGGQIESRIIVRDPMANTPDAARLSTLPAGHAQGYQQCFDAFVADTYAAIRGQRPPGLPTFADGVRVTRIVDALMESATSGTWVPIP